MKNCQKINLYARQLRNVCGIIAETSMEAAVDPNDVALDEVAENLLLNQLEQAQQLVLALTDCISDAVESAEDEKANADGDGSVFAPGELDAKKKGEIESPDVSGKKEA